MCYVFKSYMRHCDKNEAISAFAMPGALFKQSAEEEARICDKGGLGGRGGIWRVAQGVMWSTVMEEGGYS